MNSFSTDYTPRTKSVPFVGGSMPIYEQPVIEIEGEGIRDVIKAGVKKGSRIAKSKIERKVKGRAIATAKKKLNQVKKKIQTQLNQKVAQVVKKRVGVKTLPKKVTQKINKEVKSIMRNPPQKIKSKIRKNVSMEIKKTVPTNPSIKGGLSHEQLVKQAERAIYSGANF